MRLNRHCEPTGPRAARPDDDRLAMTVKSAIEFDFIML